MNKKMLINASHPEENRVAIVVDGLLSELDIELAGQQQTKGNIYKAVVVRVEPGLQAAFVDYGAEKHGFLQTGEIHPDLHPPQKKSSKEYPRINEILHRGQEILVQVVKGERGTKGAALTTFLSLPGRYMVLMPDSNTKGVSRKILDEKERKTLKKTMAQLNLPEEMGYIVRTAGIGKEEAELKRDFDYLVSLYKGILARKEKVKAPAQLYQESDIVIRSIRDYFSTEMDEVLIDDSLVFQQARDFFALVMPDQLHLVKQHREKRPIFSRYQIEEQIDSLSRNQVLLPSGGSIVIDQTEALVAIDVNSGRMAGEKGIEATAARSNIEAAAEIGRQLRLRDLGGLIVIDFIDMRDRKKIREVEQTLKESVTDDKARISLGKISQFGLLELSRQRIRPTLSVGAYLDCPHCHGKGRVKSPEAQAVALLRQLHAAVSKGQIGTIKATIPLDVANYLHNERRQALTDLEKRFNLKIQILASLDAIPEQVELELLKREKVQVEDEDQTPVSHTEALEHALAAANSPQVEKTLEVISPVAEGTLEQVAEESTPGAEVEDAGETPSGKRRRRRRRKRRNGAVETPADEPFADHSNIESGNETLLVAAAPLTAPPVEPQTEPLDSASTVKGGETIPTSAEAPVAEPSLKPKRSRRKPTAKKPVETVIQTAAGSSPVIPETPVQITEEILTPAEPVSPANVTVDKPKRRRRKPATKKSVLTENPTTAETPPEATGTQIQSTEKTLALTGPIDPVNATADKPMRRRRKPATKKPETDETLIIPNITSPAPEKPRQTIDEVEAQIATEPIKPTNAAADKPKRPRRKPATKPPVNVETPITSDAAPTQERVSQASADSVPHWVEPPAKTPIKEDKKLEEQPKRRPRKPAPKKVAEIKEVTPGAPATATPEAPKRRTRKPAAKKNDATVIITPAELSPSAAEKPKRRTRQPAESIKED